ncbi:MAG: extracellular solute-binding protein [Clostridiales bacterium]|nr:extracellular solute-binding protein [Clostridiales bacterium]
MKMRKLLSLLLALLMALSLTPALAEEKGDLWIGDYELTYWMPISSTNAQHYTSLEEHPFYIWLEEQTGVHITFIHPSWEQMEQQFGLMMNNDDFYDLIYCIEYPDGPQASVDDGVFLDMNQYKDLMPEYYEAVACADGTFADWEWGVEKELYNIGPSAPFLNRTLTPEGNMWCVTQVWTDDFPAENGGLIRQDWLDDAGLPMPQTLEDLEKVLAAFKARGEDVIPMSLGSSGVNDSSGFIVSAFDVYPAWWTVTGTQVDQHGYTVPAFKEYLTLMHKWYDLEYIDPDFMNRDHEGLVSLFLNDRLGIMVDTWNFPDYMESLYSGSDRDFDVSAMPLPRKSTDQMLQWKLHYDSCPTNYTCVTSSCENPEVAAKWLNTLYKKEVILRATYGVEGESYVMEDGVPYFTDWYFNNPDGYTVDNLREVYLMPNVTGYCSTRAFAMRESATVEQQKTTISTMQQTYNTWDANSTYSKVIGYINFEGEGWGEMYDLYVEADTYAAPMVIKFITGAESLDGFDAYAQKVLDLGMAEARDKTQYAIDRMQH